MAIGGLKTSRNLLARKRLLKRRDARRVLMETLEARHLMAVGPQLLGIQPDSGSLLENGEILHVSPKELTLRFDNGAAIDPATLSGIRIIRSGTDGVFERASAATDFSTGGQTLVEFYAQETGEVGNNIQINFSKASRTDSRAPVVTVSGRTVNVQLNSNPSLETRVEDLLQAFNPANNTAVTSLVYALRLRGSQTIGIGQSVDTTRALILGGANAAKVTTNFGSTSLQVKLSAVDSGNSGLGIAVTVTGRDRGGAGTPIVTVSGKTINVELNTNSLFASSVRDFVDAINTSSVASGLVRATLESGVATTRIGLLPITYSPLTLTGVLDVEVIPAYVGLGDSNREVVVRFAEALPDDKYRIEIAGTGVRTLRDVNGDAFNSGASRAISFELDLGAQVLSIVPQPVTRNGAGQLVQQRNQIEVYFNDDDLIDVNNVVSVNGTSIANLKILRSPLYFQNGDTIQFAAGASTSISALNPAFYQLFHTAGTLNNTDDTTIVPNSVRYYPDSDRVTLGFARNLDDLVNSGGASLAKSELRLRIGASESLPLPAAVVTPAADAGDTFASALNLGTNWTPGGAGTQSLVVNSAIFNTSPLLVDFPGANDDPGNRSIQLQQLVTQAGDTVDGISVIFYNFQGQLGTSSFNSTVQLNAITEQQKIRVREIFSLYERYLGVRFVESANRGLTIAVGDTRAVTPFEDVAGSGISGVVAPNAVGGTAYESGLLSNGQLATVLDSQDFGSSTVNEFGGAFQRAAMQGVGRLLGLGLADELEQLTIQTFNAVFAPGVGTEIVLPGDADIVHGQYLYRPESKDVDLYQFTVPQSPAGSNVSGRVTIETFAERMSQASLLDTSVRLYKQGTSGWELVAVNDDYFSSDSYIELELGAGNYIIGVTSSGNDAYDPNIANSGIGGRSEGSYQLRVDYHPLVQNVMRDSTGTALDADGDGIPGGVSDFWFRPSGPTSTKFVDKSATTTGNGTLASPYKFIKDALAAAVPGDVVRIVGNGGTDGNLSTPADNLAYEIGFDTLGRALPDGSTFDVPKDVAVIIDAGAILKMRRARIGVGSTSVNVDRSAGTLMVLGTPVLLNSAGNVIKDSTGASVPGSVYLTSASDTSLGRGSSSSIVGSSPTAGDWGGIDFRNRVDAANASRKNLEANGLFLNSISNADIRFGGGQVVVDGLSQVIAPVQMVDARPTVMYSHITSSADAAMSATPNSFLESNFHSPAELAGGSFSVDYTRVGPEIHGNRLTKNSLNGLQVRVRTGSSTQLEKMTVQGRFDDTDIVHLIPENLEIAGTPGGAVQTVVAPSSSLVTLTTQANGTLLGTFNYRFTFVTNGVESPPSEPTASVSTFGSSAVVLRNIPQGTARVYRSTTTSVDAFGNIIGAGPYELIATLAVGTSTFIDNGTTIGTLLSESLPAVTSRLDARLKIDAGTIVKLQGSRIDVSMGGQLIAEGDQGLPVIFTSLVDARYGAGGTFDTANRQGSQTAASGNWGGIYVGHTSKASIDNAVIAYGGGTTRIEGGFADFNAVETHQGDLRLANSKLELNGSGSVTSTSIDRAGRGANSQGTVFVRGSQPIIVANTIINNAGAAITANVSALNSNYINDMGRSSGEMSRVVDTIGNQGPLVKGNLLDGNLYNGMVVRGGTLTTGGVWDDTDIVHVVLDEIIVPDFHEYGGLRLESSPDASLVIKLKSGANSNAGFTATGRASDNANRIGGSVQIVGTPGQPVVLTSLLDNQVGAGFTPSGKPQNATDRSAADSNNSVVDIVLLLDDSTNSSGTGPAIATVFDQIMATLNSSLPGVNFAFSVTRFEDYSTVGGTVADRPFVLNQPIVSATTAGFSTAINAALLRTTPGTGGDVPDSGIEALRQIATGGGYDEDGDGSTTGSGLAGLVATQITPTAGGDVPAFSTFTPDPTGPVLAPSGTIGGVGFRSNSTKRIVLMASDIATVFEPDAINPYIGKDGVTVPSLALQANGRGTTPNGTGAQIQQTVDALVANNIQVIGLADGVNAQGVLGGLATLTGAVDANGQPLVFDITAATPNQLANTIVNAIKSAVATATPGDWRSVLLDTNSNDRNVAVVTENESAAAVSATANGQPANSQYLGQLAASEMGGDENKRLGFQIQGVIAHAGDVDVYSFNAQAGTEVWFDIDRTLNSLDTVVELVDSNGRTLALSNDSFTEEADPSLLYRAPELAAQSVNPLRKSDTSFYAKNANGTPKDLYSTNTRDAGFRIVLPGESGATNLYHVRVRSSNLNVGDPASKLRDSTQIGSGLTQGNYQLELRLGEVDEVPGSAVTYADIRFASNGIELVGVPGNSPLLGENTEIEIRSIDYNADGIIDATNQSNNTLNNAQALGNLLATNRQALSVAGNLDAASDVDWFSFVIDHENVTPTGLRQYFSTVFDADYGDGIGRPDLSLYVFDGNGNLILAGLNSNLVDDQASPINGADSSDLSRGSSGGLDPYIGSFALPGRDLTTPVNSGVYFVAVTNSRMVPSVLASYTNQNAPASVAGVRMQPIEGIRLIADDQVGTDLKINVPSGAQLQDGSTVRIRDSRGTWQVYEFDNNGVTSGTNVPVAFTASLTAIEVASVLQNAIQDYNFSQFWGNNVPVFPSVSSDSFGRTNQLTLFNAQSLDVVGPNLGTPVLFPVASNSNGISSANDSVVDWSLTDMALYVSRDVGTNLTSVYVVNPFTGETRGQLGRAGFDLSDIAFRPNGDLRAFDRALETRAANADQDGQIDYVGIDSGTGVTTAIGTSGLQTNHLEFNQGNAAAAASDDGVHPEALTFATIGGQERGFFVGSRPTPSGFTGQGYSQIPGFDGFDWTAFNRQNPGTARPGPSYFTNVLYEFDENTGTATSAPFGDKTGLAVAFGAGTAVVDRGYIETLPIDPITGLPDATLLSNLLVAREATTSTTNTGGIANILDGDTLQLLDSANFPVNFEFDLGPEVRVNYDPANGFFVRDGMQFTLDGTTYEFDTGSVISINAFIGAQLADGSTVRIRNASGIERIFEFDSNNQVTGVNNVRVAFTAGSTQQQLTQALVTAINSETTFGVTANANFNRVSLTNASTTFPVVVTGIGLNVTGTPGVTALGNVRIPISETATLQEFVGLIDQYVAPSITVSFDGGRMNFSGATNGSFTDLVNAGIFTSAGSSGGTAGGNIPIRILVSDTAETIAARITLAINSSSIPGLSATLSGDSVTINGGTVATGGPMVAAGLPPGGVIRGIAVIGTTMYAVSDNGGLYVVQNPTAGGFGNVGTYVATSYDLIGINFTGLVAGPANITGADGTQYSQLLFGIDSNGDMHAFNTAGRLQPVFANGATSISTGLTSATGLAFSTLNRNLWSVTGREPVVNGQTQHGLPATPNDTRVTTTGGTSLAFQSGGNNPDYNFPGGAAGAIESAPFDLSGLGAADSPTLYFNYYFETEQAGASLPIATNPQDYMRDSLRVYVSGEDGEWTLVATNNGTRGGGSADDEFDIQPGNPLNQVQELFDNNGQWRQARISLSAFAGQKNVKLRFEFSSAGGFGYGLEGGRGPEIRTIEASRLTDGETLTIHGQVFEIEMGNSLTLPGGSGMINGTTITIDGTRYVFTDGSGPPPASPDIAVPYLSTQTAEELAATLLNVIQTATPVRQNITGLNFSLEGNEVISNASLTGATGDTVRIVGSGVIGDNPVIAVAGQDVDMVRIDADAGSTITVAVDASSIGSTLNSFLRVFDGEGRLLLNAFGNPIQNDNRPGSTDSLLTFVAPKSGTYYIGVSGAGNQAYNSTVSVGATTGSVGNYNLTIDITRKLNPIQDGNRLQLDGAKTVAVSQGSPVLLQGGLGTTSGVAVPVTVDMTALEVAEALRASIAAFFANGAINAYPIRSGDTLELTGLVEYDSFDFVTGQATPSLFELDSGPFGATRTFIGDVYSAFNTGTNPNGTTNGANPGVLGAQDNVHGGVYLDDFIIGISGRGEMVLNATGGDSSFIVDPQLSLTTPTRPNLEILTGAYQFEIRGGDDYGIPLIDVPPVRYLLTDSFQPDQRLVNGTSIRFNAATQLRAGDTFTLSDGTNVLTFELDDVNDGIGVQPDHIAVPFNTAAVDGATGARRSETAEEIAGRVRDIINSPAIQLRIKLTANLLNNDRSSSTSDTVVLIGQATANVPTAVGTTIISRGKGTENRERPQGQVVINSARITNSLGFGATVSSSARQTSTDPLLNTLAATPGSPRNLITLNTEQLAPGAVIMNSEFLFNGTGGISVQGVAQTAGLPAAAVPFVRLVNNTVIGGTVAAVTQFAPTVYGDQFFNIGDLAFADTVVSYSPLLAGGPGPILGLDNRNNAIGAPNFTGSGEPLANEGVVSLGRGGQIVLQFTNNLLTGSGNANPDLRVFEVGDSEEVLVEVSADGSRWTSVGRASSATPTIDIDAFGFNTNSRLAFVRLTDVVSQGSQSGNSVGADIDAVGAISSVPADIYQAGGDGISITNNATATLLNNVIVNAAVGIRVDASSSSTVVGGTTFQRNVANVAGSATLGQFSSVVNNNIPLFVDVSGGNVYPASTSPIIDSSIDSLQDRPSLVAVKQPLGISASPILAPQYDVNGQLRVDDPAVETPFGLGENVFKDRGSQDRADFVGASVILVNPADNDLQGLDKNSDVSIVELSGQTLKYFDILLFDGIEPSDPGSGSTVNPATVQSSSVLVYRDNIPLVEGLDYTFGYNATSGIIRLTPLAGIWRSESVYTIRFINTNESSVVARAGAEYIDGSAFDIIDASGSRTTFEFDSGYLVSVPSINGIDADIIDGTTFALDDGTRRVIFEFDSNSSVTSPNVPVSLGVSPTPVSVAAAIKTAISSTTLSLTATDLGTGVIQIQGNQNLNLLANDSDLIVAGQPGVRSVFGLQIPLSAGVPVGLTEGQTFSINRNGTAVVFELDTDGNTSSGSVAVRFNTGATAAQVGNALVTAINGAGLGLSPSYVSNGFVRLGGDANTRLTLINTTLTQRGVPGSPAAIAIPISATAGNPATNVAALIKTAIDGANLPGISTTQFGSRVVVEGATGLAGEGVGLITAISDFAGNTLKANQVDGSTVLTIFLGEGLDYGDAPNTYGTLKDSNGPRHTVVDGLSLGATVTSDADAKLTNADVDDGVIVTPVFSGFNATYTVTVTNTTGATAYLSFWIDINGDGVFATTERFGNQVAVASAATPTTLPYTIRMANAKAGTSYARFRLSTDAVAVSTPVGFAKDGEVEDILLNVSSSPYKNPSTISSVIDANGNNLDVTADGSVSPIDALRIINSLRLNGPRDLTLPVTAVPPYLDVNGDGRVTALDALLVVNFLNARRLAGNGEGEFSAMGGISPEGEADASMFGSGTQDASAGNWIAGLENVLVNSPAETDESSDEAIIDTAILATQDDDYEPFTVVSSLESSLLDEVLAEAEDDQPNTKFCSSVDVHDQLFADLF